MLRSVRVPDAKTELLLLILRMLGMTAEKPADLRRLNASRPAVVALVARAHVAAIEIGAAAREDLAARMKARKRGEPKPHIYPVKRLASVTMKESSFRIDVVGKAGERSLMQIKPDGIATYLCPDLLDQLDRPRQNILCGIRILRDAERRCGPDPLDFLGRFNGTRECGPTAYARKVLAIEAAASRDTHTEPVAAGDTDRRAVTPTDVAPFERAPL